MATSNFSLPIAAQGLPPLSGNGGGFGQPSGVSINPPNGGYGGVAGTHPGNTFQVCAVAFFFLFKIVNM